MRPPTTRERRLRAVWATLATAVLFAVAGAGTVVSAADVGGSVAIQSVNTTDYPTMVIRVGLPAQMLSAGDLKTSDFQVRENGAPVTKLAVRPLSKRRAPLQVVLAIDVSGSMKGPPLQDAKSAATGFIDAMGPDDRVALVTFSDTANIVQGFTGDKAALGLAVEGLEAGRETALYDALVTAAGLFGGKSGSNRAIVLLSDGGDTMSGQTLDSTAKVLTDAKVAVHAVTLVTGEYNPKALESLSLGSGGSLLPVSDSGQLRTMFEGIAKQLMSPYEISFVSDRPSTKEIEVDILVSSRDLRASATAVVQNPSFTAGTTKPAPTPGLPGAGWPAVIAVLVFASAGLSAAVFLLMVRPEANTLRQLQYYEQLRSSGAGSGDSDQWDPDSVGGRMLQIADTVAARGGVAGAVRVELERAGLPLRVTEYMLLHVFVVLGGGFLVQIVGGRLLLTIPMIFVLALGPLVLLRYLGQKRKQAFQDQLPDVLNLISGSLRAGWGLLQAVGIVVSEMAPPAGPEFGRVVNEARLGLPLEDALEKMAERVGSDDFKWAVTAITIQRDVGGNLAEVLDIVAGSVRERASLNRQISSLTAEGRISSIILMALPFVEVLFLSFLNPGYMSTLFTSAGGMVLLVFTFILLVIGGLWLRRIVKIEV